MCICFSKYEKARLLGIYVYSKSYVNDFLHSSFKLFLESYFDIVICTMINLVSFKRSKNAIDFAEFFGTWSDTACSTITIVYTFTILYMPVFVYKLIRNYKDDLDNQNELLRIVMEGVNPHNYNATMYTFYFVVRRLLTGVILVVFHEYPFFQCSSLLIFSTVNFIYIVSDKPLEGKENRLEIFNEVCIIGCAHIFNIFVRG